MRRVLVVDDEPSILQLFRYVFEDAGYEVLTAQNGREGLDALAAAGQVDLVILDVAMPVMDGREFITELGRRAAGNASLAKIPFVVMTGENFMDTRLNRTFALVPGFVCFFPKMTPPEIVLEKAREVLGE
jgi:two-component system alkaline phosphatase synthesis response regulator PhoP